MRRALRAIGPHLLAWVSIATLLSACGVRPPRGAPATVLRLLLPASERPFWQPIADRFAVLHPGVRVELVEGPQSTDLREDLYTAALLARDPTFDLVYMDVTWTSKFAAAGWLRPLDTVLPPGDRHAFMPGALEAGLHDGTLYRLPVRTDVGVLYYRRDLLDAAGLDPPETLEDLKRVARALQRPPTLWGFVWQGKQYEGLVCNYLELLAGCGGFWVDPGTLAVGLDRPEALRALRFMTDSRGVAPISPPGVTTYEEEESRHLFQDGRAVFLRSWPYAWSLAQANESVIRGHVGVMPMVHAPGAAAAVTLGGWGLGVSSFSHQPDLAVELIRFAVSLEGQRLLCLPTGYAPARRDAYRDTALLAANPFLAELETLHGNAIARPTVARYALISDILQRHLSAALAGIQPPERALADAAHETRLALVPEAAAAGPNP